MGMKGLEIEREVTERVEKQNEITVISTRMRVSVRSR
jgi:hypothetical protein